jgi:hypothetical protein
VTTYLTVFHASGATSDSATRVETAQRLSRVLLSVLPSTVQSSLHGLVFDLEGWTISCLRFGLGDVLGLGQGADGPDETDQLTGDCRCHRAGVLSTVGHSS